MKGYTVTFRYTTSIDVFVAAKEERPLEDLEEIVEIAKDAISDSVYEREIIKNLKRDKFNPYTIRKE